MRESTVGLMRIGCATLIALLTSGSAGATTKGPDAGGYVATDSTVYSFVDIAGGSGGASVLADTDDGMAALTLPFPFRFYGQAYPIVCVSANGAMYFLDDAAACNFNDFANIDVTSVSPPGDRPAVMPLWSDLTFQVPGAGALFYQTLGIEGSRTFVVQWNNAYPQGSPNPVTFQVLLSEGSGNILFQYKTIALGPGNPAARGGQATIGVRSAAALTNQRQIAWSFQAPVVDDETAVLFSADDGPPETTAALSGPAGSNGWYRGAVTVALSATDGSGPVAATRYSVDGGAVLPYSAPFTISGDGNHSLSFFSIDTSGNSETPKTVAVRIDATAPDVSAASQPGVLWPATGRTVPVIVSGSLSDATSGFDGGSARFTVEDEYGEVEPGGTLTVTSTGLYSVTVSLVASRRAIDRDGRTFTIVVLGQDNAGNPGQATITVTVPHDRGNAKPRLRP
jgi:hypothetical protein